MNAILISSAVVLVLCAQVPTSAQSAPPGPLDIAGLQQAAVEADPRFRELQLQEAQTELRLANIETQRLPSLVAEGQLQYQSDVPTPPSFVPGAPPLFLPPKGTVDAFVRVEQPIADPTIGARLAVERAQLAEGLARVRATLFGLRQEVNDAFFAAAVLQERAGALAATIAELEAELRETNTRVREGAALPADAAAVEATLLQRRQDEEELRANRATALSRLSDLTGRTITESDRLGWPDLHASVERTRASIAGAGKAVRARPEYEQFDRVRERLARQQDAAAAEDRPRFSLYARLGYGLPGLNVIGDQFEPYGLAGLRVQWSLWRWGASAREREALGIQQQIVAADEAAFSRGVGRVVVGDSETIQRLERSLALDDRIVTLREQVARTADIRFREGAVTASEYLDRSTELLQARFALAGHRVELGQASARFLTTLGLEVR